MDSHNNPYQAPESDVSIPEAPMALDAAGKGRRFGTYIVDYVGYMVLAGFIGAVLGFTFGEQALWLFEGATGIFVSIGIMFVYYGVFEGLWARTPGKWVFGTVVVTEQGHRPSFGQIMGRTACRFLPFEPFSLLLNETGTGWHDSIPRTRVVMAR